MRRYGKTEGPPKPGLKKVGGSNKAYWKITFKSKIGGEKNIYKDWRQSCRGSVLNSGKEVSMAETKGRDVLVCVFAHWDLESRGRVREVGEGKEQR